MRKLERQVRNFLRRVSGHGHPSTEKIVQIMLLAARDGVNYEQVRFCKDHNYFEYTPPSTQELFKQIMAAYRE